jgi:D-glycero-alpha-D-manno-heptose-7-phosphate kinase
VIISRTPLRISFLGGGSDLPAFYHDEAGAVIGTAIDKYIYITVNRKFDHKIRASYSVTEMVDSIDELKHELIREAMRLVGIDGGIEITSISDIPSQGTGLGSSSSYTVGLLNALYAYKGKLVGAERLANEACRIEIDICGKPIGKQDQYLAAYGGFKYVQFFPDEHVEVMPVLCNHKLTRQIETNLLLLYTGMTRSADTILAQQSHNTRNGNNARQSLRRMVKMAETLRSDLGEGKTECFGHYLHEGWMEKRSLAEGVSNPQLDQWYNTALEHGARGGKILGAGGGGFLLVDAAPEHHGAIIAALPELMPVPFQFEPQGSRIIYVEGENH